MVNAEKERVILNVLKDVRTRMHRQDFLQKGTSAVFCGLLLLAMLFVMNRFVPLPIFAAEHGGQAPVLRYVGVVGFALLVVLGTGGVGICLSFRCRKDLRTVARSVDLQMGLKERLGTAYELIDAIARDRLLPDGEDSAGGFAHLQIRDAANAVLECQARLHAAFPYRVPGILKAFPIPLLFIALSFAVPLRYDVPLPLTAAQQNAVDAAVQNLEKMQADAPTLQAQIRETGEKLKAAKDVREAQMQLSALNAAVRKQKTEQHAEMEASIADATQATPRFKGMNAERLAAELEALAAQSALSSELQAELAELFARLAKSLPNTPLAEMQGKGVSAETLRDIAEILREAKAFTQLARLEAQLTASRKELALASIDTATPSGGVANSDGAPGQESGNAEVQGTLETAAETSPAREERVSKDRVTAGDRPPRYDDDASLLTGDDASSLQVTGKSLMLTTEPSAESQRFSRVFTGEEVLTGDNDYPLFSDVVLNAKREYARAIENNRIPTRYQAQIQAYLEAVANEK